MRDFVIKKVLAPIDFSETSINALETAIALSKKHGAQLSIIHVLENTRFLYTAAGGLSAIALLPELLRTANEKLSEISSKIRVLHQLNVRYAVLTGSPVDGICEEATRNEADIVVLGSHGTSNFRELFLGSTACLIVKNAPVPVLTVPHDRPWRDFRKILFPVRQDSNSFDKCEFMLPIVRMDRASVLIAGIVNNNDRQAQWQVEQTVEEIQSKLVSDDIPCGAQFFECKNLSRQVLEIAQNEKPDLIVITTTSASGIWDIFSPPFAQDVVNHSHFPVLSIRPRIEVDAQMKAVQFVDERLGDHSMVFG
jgi:nucleotide-binding universal stress UspA family protein